MKVLHIYRSMGQGGVQRIILQLCKGNKDITQCVASSGGYYVEELKEQGISHFIIDDIENKNPIIILRTFRVLKGIVKKEKVTIIHTHHRMAAVYGRLLTFNNPKLCHIYTSHNVFFGKRNIMRFALKNARIVAVGEGVKNNLCTEYGIPKDRINVIYNAIDENEVDGTKNEIIETLKKRGKYVIGAVGRLSKQKGFDVLLKAMKTVVEEFPDVSLVFVGDGEERESLSKIASDLEVNNNVFFLGYQKNVLDIINQLEFIIMPSRWEGLPLVPIETFSQRKTMIATNIAGTNEIIVDNENGLLVESEDYSSLSKAILELIMNRNKKEKLEKAAYTKYINDFSYSVFLDKYKNEYLNPKH